MLSVCKTVSCFLISFWLHAKGWWLGIYFLVFSLLFISSGLTGAPKATTSTAAPRHKKSHTVFIAYSLREACNQAKAGNASRELLNLGGITRIAGMVYDREGKDIILVGLAASELPGARFDDLVVALRARLVHNEWPLVSIDPVVDTERTKLQRVRFDGHLENTSFGRDLLDCDIVLKLYSLQKIRAIPSVRSYNLLLEEDIRCGVERTGAKVTQIRWCSPDKGIKLSENHHGMGIFSSESHEARFWFYAMEPYTTARKQDVFCIKELRLGVQSENIYQDKPELPQGARERFSKAWTEHLDELCRKYAVLRRLKVLYDLVAVADAIRKIERNIEKQPYLRYLLEDYHVPRVRTDPNYKLEELYGIVERSDGLRHLIRISGGIELRPEIRLLNYGDVTILRSIVVSSRPSPHTLTWPLSLYGWRMPNARDLKLWAEDEGKKPERIFPGGGDRAGCSILCRSIIVDPKLTTDDSSVKRFFGFPPPPPPPLRGVSMRMKVSDESFKPAEDNKLNALRENILKSRPSSDAESWPVQESEKTNEKRKE